MKINKNNLLTNITSFARRVPRPFLFSLEFESYKHLTKSVVSTRHLAVVHSN